jgi:hypothetical protein
MKNKKAIPQSKLSEEDKVFARKIADDYEIPVDIMEAYMHGLLEYLRLCFKSRLLIGKIDYKVKPSQGESIHLKAHSIMTLYHIYHEWDIGKFRKCIIAGLVLHHFKLDKYERILTEDEFWTSQKYSARDYKHYLYNRLKTRFKRWENPK